MTASVMAYLLLAGLLGALPGALPGGAALGQAAGAGSDAADAGAVIVMYHRFGDDRFPSTNIRLEQFEAHLAELKRGGYAVRPVPEIVAALRDGTPLPPRTVGITIDDAYRTVYSEAWPRLRAAGFPFTVFVATEPVERGYREMMRWEQLREMVSGGGVTIGNHSVRHGHMATLAPAAAREELEQAGRLLAVKVGALPTLLAYPYGEYGLTLRNVAAGMGFQAAFGQHSGAIGRDADRFTLPRFALNEHYGEPERFRLAVDSLPLPVRDVAPADPLVRPEDNPPLIGITIAEAAGPLQSLRCYLSGQGALPLRSAGERRLEGRPAQPLPPGRSRINCTLPAGKGRWRWWGMPFYRPGN